MTRLRAAVVGLGVGEQHIAGYRAHPACEVVAICDSDPAKLAQVGERHPELRRAADARELLEDPEIEVVSIASWDDAHFEQLRVAIGHGKHVFAEKPLVLHEDEARVVHALLREHPQVRLSSNVPLRRSPRFQLVRDWIRAGRLGELFHLEGDYDYGRRHKLTDGWRGRIPHYSVVLGGAIHIVDLLLWMSGERVTEVMAYGSRIATRGSAFAHDDFVGALMRLESGATAKVTANLGCVSPHFHGVRIYGTEATFVNGLPDGALYTPAPPPRGADVTPIDAPYPGVHKGDLIHSFIESILTGAPAEVTAQDVFATLEVCFAIERSVAMGAPVPVRSIG